MLFLNRSKMLAVCLAFILLIAENEGVKFQTKGGLLPTRKECGVEFSGKFPWVIYVLAESRTYNPGADIRCAGALISKRYAIVNKSCLQFYFTKVYLGLNDVTANSTALKLDVVEKKVEENFDVVLLRLSEDVSFSDTIRPICLPFEDFHTVTPGDKVYSSGWGLTSYEGHNSNLKKSVQATLEGSCITTPDRLKRNNSLCIKVDKTSSDKPCSGDEGSPIMYNDKGQWILVGILDEVFDSTNRPCSIEEAAGGSKISEEVLSWIIEKIH